MFACKLNILFTYNLIQDPFMCCMCNHFMRHLNHGCSHCYLLCYMSVIIFNNYNPFKRYYCLCSFFLFANVIPQAQDRPQRHLVRNSFIVELVEGHRKLRHLFLFNDVIVCAKYKVSITNTCRKNITVWLFIMTLFSFCYLRGNVCTHQLTEISSGQYPILKHSQCKI